MIIIIKKIIIIILYVNCCKYSSHYCNTLFLSYLQIVNKRKDSNPYITRGRLKFRLCQILINAVALLAIAGEQRTQRETKRSYCVGVDFQSNSQTPADYFYYMCCFPPLLLLQVD